MSLDTTHPVWPLPSTFPLPSLCVTLTIPDDPYYIAQLNELLSIPASWTAYDRDTAHNGKRAAAVWKLVLKSLEICPTPTPPTPTPVYGGFCDDMPLVRQEGCLFQMQCVDGSWVTVYDPSMCLPDNLNPPPGTTPPQGKCAGFNAQFHARDILYIPANVSAGDTIELTAFSGAGNDGGTTTWYCADGNIFIAGSCVPGGGTNSGDPLNTAKHMCLIAHIGTAYYDLTQGKVTIPSGVTNQPVLIQVNDSDITNDQGSYTITVNVCNNSGSSSPGSCEYDFTAGQQGFVDGEWDGVPGAIYVAGQGWTNGNPADQALCDPCKLVAHNSNLIGADIEYVRNSLSTSYLYIWNPPTLGSNAGGSHGGSGNCTPNMVAALTAPAGVIATASLAFTCDVSPGTYLGIWAADFHNTQGDITIRKVTFHYADACPF